MSPEAPEEWRWIPGFERRYQVSNLGRVRSFQRTGKPRVMRLFMQGRVQYAALGAVGGHRTVGELVLLAFVGPRPKRHFALRKNRVQADNRLENLFWGSAADMTYQRHKRYVDLAPLVPLIKRRLNSETCTAIAKDLGVHPSSINRIKNGKRHAHG